MDDCSLRANRYLPPLPILKTRRIDREEDRAFHLFPAGQRNLLNSGQLSPAPCPALGLHGDFNVFSESAGSRRSNSFWRIVRECRRRPAGAFRSGYLPPAGRICSRIRADFCSIGRCLSIERIIMGRGERRARWIERIGTHPHDGFRWRGDGNGIAAIAGLS